jgi:hypothetical protein
MVAACSALDAQYEGAMSVTVGILIVYEKPPSGAGNIVSEEPCRHTMTVHAARGRKSLDRK